MSGPFIFIATNGIGGETELADTCCQSACWQSGADLGLPGTALVPQPGHACVGWGTPRHRVGSRGRRCAVAEERSVFLRRGADVPVEGRSNGRRGAESS